MRKFKQMASTMIALITVFAVFSGMIPVATASQSEKVARYTTAVTESEIAKDLGITKSALVDSATLNGEEVDLNNMQINPLAAAVKIGAQGRLTEIYKTGTDAYEIVMVDQFLARVTSVDEVDASSTELGLSIYGEGDVEISVNLIMNGTVEYSKGDVLLVYYNYKTEAVAIIGYAMSMVGAQSAFTKNTDSHIIEDVEYYDAIQFNHDETAARDTNDYTWYFDTYGNVIGAMKIATASTYGVISSIYWKNSSDGEEGCALATVTYTDGASEEAAIYSIDGVVLEGIEGNAADYAAGYVSATMQYNKAEYTNKALYKLANSKNGLRLTTTAVLAADTTIETGVPALNDGLNAGQSTQFLVWNGKSYEAYAGIRNVPTYEGTVNGYYVDARNDGVADIIFVLKPVEPTEKQTVLYYFDGRLSEKTYLKNSAVDYYSLIGGYVNGVEEDICFDAEDEALMESISTMQNTLMVLNIEGGYVVDYQTVTEEPTSVKINGATYYAVNAGAATEAGLVDEVLMSANGEAYNADALENVFPGSCSLDTVMRNEAEVELYVVYTEGKTGCKSAQWVFASGKADTDGYHLEVEQSDDLNGSLFYTAGEEVQLCAEAWMYCNGDDVSEDYTYVFEWAGNCSGAVDGYYESTAVLDTSVDGCYVTCTINAYDSNNNLIDSAVVEWRLYKNSQYGVISDIYWKDSSDGENGSAIATVTYADGTSESVSIYSIDAIILEGVAGNTADYACGYVSSTKQYNKAEYANRALYQMTASANGLRLVSVAQLAADTTIETGIPAMSDDLNAGKSTQFLVWNGKTYEIYTGIRNVPTYAGAVDGYYVDVRNDAVADIIFVIFPEIPTNHQTVLYYFDGRLTEKANLKNDVVDYYTLTGGYVNGMKEVVTFAADNAALKDEIAALEGTLMVLDIEDGYVVGYTIVEIDPYSVKIDGKTYYAVCAGAAADAALVDGVLITANGESFDVGTLESVITYKYGLEETIKNDGDAQLYLVYTEGKTGYQSAEMVFIYGESDSNGYSLQLEQTDDLDGADSYAKDAEVCLYVETGLFYNDEDVTADCSFVFTWSGDYVEAEDDGSMSSAKLDTSKETCSVVCSVEAYDAENVLVAAGAVMWNLSLEAGEGSGTDAAADNTIYYMAISGSDVALNEADFADFWTGLYSNGALKYVKFDSVSGGNLYDGYADSNDKGTDVVARAARCYAAPTGTQFGLNDLTCVPADGVAAVTIGFTAYGTSAGNSEDVVGAAGSVKILYMEDEIAAIEYISETAICLDADDFISKYTEVTGIADVTQLQIKFLNVPENGVFYLNDSANASGVMLNDANIRNHCFSSSATAEDSIEHVTYVPGIDLLDDTVSFACYCAGEVQFIGTITFTAGTLKTGDINGDGYVDSADALIALRFAVGLTTLTEAQMEVADVNKDGFVDAGDAIKILRYDARLIDSLD